MNFKHPLILFVTILALISYIGIQPISYTTTLSSTPSNCPCHQETCCTSLESGCCCAKEQNSSPPSSETIITSIPCSDSGPLKTLSSLFSNLFFTSPTSYSTFFSYNKNAAFLNSPNVFFLIEDLSRPPKHIS